MPLPHMTAEAIPPTINATRCHWYALTPDISPFCRQPSSVQRESPANATTTTTTTTKSRFDIPAQCDDRRMPVILPKDIARGQAALTRWRDIARSLAVQCDELGQTRHSIHPDLPRPVWAMAVRYSLFLLERRAPGPGVEVRVAPWGAVKILDGPESDPHNLTPPDVIELEPAVWLRLATGITTWAEEREAGHISAVGERDDLSGLLPL